MLDLPEKDLWTERLRLSPLRVEDASAFWEVLRDPAIYTWIERDPPATPAEVEARFARIARRTEFGREDQWLNWTVWTRDGGPIGIVEATVRPSGLVSLAYMFASRFWGRGYAHEATTAAIERMVDAGAAGFEAAVDARNRASTALLSRLGFSRRETRDGDEIWRRPA